VQATTLTGDAMGGETATGTDERLLVGPSDAEFASPPALVPVEQIAPVDRDAKDDAAWSAAWRSTRRGVVDGVGVALSSDAARGVGFLFLPVFMAAGALVYFSAGAEPSVWSVTMGAAASAGLALLVRERPAARASLLGLAFFLAGMLAADYETRRSQTLITGSAVATGVTGRVLRIEHREDGRVRLTLDVLETARPTLRYPPPRVRVTAREIPSGLAAGDVVNGYARLMPPSGPVRPGGYDFAFESWFDGIGAIGFFLGNPERAEWPESPGHWRRAGVWVEDARLAIAARVRAHIAGAEGEIAAALIAGVRAGIPEDINEALRRTGLAHVLSISGLHMALVALTVMLSLRLAFALFPDFASRHPTKKYGAAVALLACAVYLAISGAAVAAQRSFIMLAVMLLALLIDRAALTMRNLAIAALAVIAISPHEVAGPSFQMSFGATAALIGAYAAWSQYRMAKPRRPHVQKGLIGNALMRLGYGFTGLAMTSIIAGLATTIYGVYHFHRVSPYSLGANLLAMPVVSFLVMPWAVAGVLLMPFGLEWLPLAVMGKGLALMNAIAIWFSQRSPIDAVGLIPPASVVVFTLALVAATLPTTRLRLLALPLVMLGFGLVLTRTMPDVLISEDARLVALRLDDGRLAVNRQRPNGFTIDNWAMALAAPELLRPAKEGEGEAASDGFVCSESACVARTTRGHLIVHTADRSTAAEFCGTASLIVMDNATVRNPCPTGSAATVVDKRTLARRGSASVVFTEGAAKSMPSVTVDHAIDEPFRPWHEHRHYSREARGLPPYERRASHDEAEGQ
jgi:ComEC/Rec2-related protein